MAAAASRLLYALGLVAVVCLMLTVQLIRPVVRSSDSIETAAHASAGEERATLSQADETLIRAMQGIPDAPAAETGAAARSGDGRRSERAEEAARTDPQPSAPSATASTQQERVPAPEPAAAAAPTTLAARERSGLEWASKGTLAELRAERGFLDEPLSCHRPQPTRIVLHPKLRMGTKVDNAWVPAAGSGFRRCIPEKSACKDEQCKEVDDACQIAMAEAGSAEAARADVWVAYGFLVHHAAQQYVTRNRLPTSAVETGVNESQHAHAFRRHMQETGVVPPSQPARQLWVLYNRDITALPLFAQRAFNATVGYDLYTADIVCPAFLPSIEHLRKRKIVPVEERKWLVSSLVSDCEEYSGRDAYITELERYIPVARMGMCNHNVDLPCDSKPKKERFNISEPCPLGADATEKERDKVVTSHLMHYKFHLSFERVRCEGYVSEKVFNPMGLGVVPVYLGSPLVEKVAISTRAPWVINAHNFDSPKALAEYLLHLDRHPDEYRKYLAWRDDDSVLDPSYTRLSQLWSVHRSTRMCQLCDLYCELMRAHDRTGQPIVSRASACPDPRYNPAECGPGSRRCTGAREIKPLPYLDHPNSPADKLVHTVGAAPIMSDLFTPVAIRAVLDSQLPRQRSASRRA